MEFFTQLQTFWNEYGPMVLGIGASIAAVGGTILTIYLKLKPVWDGLKAKVDTIKNKVDNPEKEDITNLLQRTDLDTKITDLKAKLENPTISDALKQAYITQLATLETIKAKLDAGVAKVEDTASKF